MLNVDGKERISTLLVSESEQPVAFVYVYVIEYVPTPSAEGEKVAVPFPLSTILPAGPVKVPPGA